MVVVGEFGKMVVDFWRWSVRKKMLVMLELEVSRGALGRSVAR